MDRNPQALHAPQGARVLEVIWDDGQASLYRHRDLRAFCPCAHCQGHHGAIRWVEESAALSDEALELKEILEVGSYALRLVWGDGHATGIYSFVYLEQLAPLYAQSEDERKTRTFGR